MLAPGWELRLKDFMGGFPNKISYPQGTTVITSTRNAMWEGNMSNPVLTPALFFRSSKLEDGGMSPA